MNYYRVEIVLFRLYRVPAFLVRARDEATARARARAIVDTAHQGPDIEDDDYQATIIMWVP